MNDTLDQAKLTPAQERVMEAARAHRSVYGRAIPNPDYPYQVSLRSARALVEKGLLREVVPSHTDSAPEFTLVEADPAPKLSGVVIDEAYTLTPAALHAAAREQLSKQFRGVSLIRGVSLNIPLMTEAFEELKDAAKRAHSLGFSHAAILTGKHTYAGTVTAKEKAARRRRNAAARVSRRKNRGA